MNYAYCRLCMSEDNLFLIKKSIRKFIEAEYKIEINDENRLSNEICATCKTAVKKIIKLKAEAEKFFNDVIHVQNLLKKILKQKDTPDATRTIVEEASTQVDSTDDPVTIVSTDDSPMIDLTLSSCDDASSEAVKSIDKMTPYKEINFCNICKRKSLNADKFQKHLISATHKYKEFVVKKTRDGDFFLKYALGYTCPCCTEIFTNKVYLVAHVRFDHKVPMNQNKLRPDTVVRKNNNKDDKDVKKNIEELLHCKVKNEPDIQDKAAVQVSSAKKRKSEAETPRRKKIKTPEDIVFTKREEKNLIKPEDDSKPPIPKTQEEPLANHKSSVTSTVNNYTRDENIQRTGGRWRNDDRTAEHYSSRPTTTSSSSKVLKIATVNRSNEGIQPNRGRWRNNDRPAEHATSSTFVIATETRYSQRNWGNRHSYPSGQTTRICGTSQIQRSSQQQFKNHRLDQNTYSTEVNSKRSNDYNVNRFSTWYRTNSGPQRTFWDCPKKRNTYSDRRQ